MRDTGRPQHPALDARPGQARPLRVATPPGGSVRGRRFLGRPSVPRSQRPTDEPFEALQDDGHASVELAPGGEVASEEVLVCSPPVRQRAVALSLRERVPRGDAVQVGHRDVRDSEHRSRAPPPVAHDGEVADLRERLVVGLVGPQRTRGRRLGACKHQAQQLVRLVSSPSERPRVGGVKAFQVQVISHPCPVGADEVGIGGCRSTHAGADAGATPRAPWPRACPGCPACRRARRSSRRPPGARRGTSARPRRRAGPAPTRAARHSTSVGTTSTSVDPDPLGAGAQQPVELVDGAAAQVVLLVADRHHVAVPWRRSRPAGSISSSVRSPTAPRPSSSRAPGRRTPSMISSSASSPASLWARSMTTDDLARQGVKKFIRPGLCSASGRKVRSPSTTVVARDPDRQGGRRGGQRVLDVEAGQPGQRHRYVDQLDQRVGVGAGPQHRRPSRR